MAETADVLTPEHIEVILPNAAARCPMAEMAQEDEVREALELLLPGGRHNWPTPLTPIAYVNSTAAVKAIVGEHGGACCTSANAETVMRWALRGGDRTQEGGTGKGNDSAQRGRVLFLPDEHLGRNVCARLGVAADEQALWDPTRQHVGPPPEHLRATRVYHWKGYCYVHRRFRSEDVRAMREDAQRRGIALRVVAHPECVAEVVNQCDATASTERMVEMLDAAEPGTHWALATEAHLVSRMARRAAARGVDVRIVGRSGMAGPMCGAMLQIAPMDLLHVLERLNAGEPVNVVRVRPEVREGARLALERMLRMA
jgi:quinolinate synthase